MKTVVIADDHPLVLTGVEALLTNAGFRVIGAYRDGDSLLHAIPTCRADLFVIDISMPGITGLDVLRIIRGRGDERPVVLLTASINDNNAIEAIRAGVNGLVLKESAPNVLLLCLAAVAKGEKWIDRDVMRRALDSSLQPASHSASRLEALTRRELAIAHLIARGYANRRIAADLNISEGTVKAHLHRIYKKLGVTHRTALILRVQEEGRPPLG